jgi:hypothetical protein
MDVIGRSIKVAPSEHRSYVAAAKNPPFPRHGDRPATFGAQASAVRAEGACRRMASLCAPPAKRDRLVCVP